MKRKYLMPSQLVCELQSSGRLMTPLSLQDGNADPAKEVLTKEFLLDLDEEEGNGIKDPKFFD